MLTPLSVVFCLLAIIYIKKLDSLISGLEKCRSNFCWVPRSYTPTFFDLQKDTQLSETSPHPAPTSTPFEPLPRIHLDVVRPAGGELPGAELLLHRPYTFPTRSRDSYRVPAVALVDPVQRLHRPGETVALPSQGISRYFECAEGNYCFSVSKVK